MKSLLLSLAIALMVQSAQAAIPNSKETAVSAFEILSMPEANRNEIALQKANEIYPELIQIAKSEKQEMNIRWKALTLAAYIGKDRALPELASALKSKEWFMRNAALISLKSYHPLKAQAAARDLLKDKALVVRSAAAEVLGNQPDAQSRDLLWEELYAPYNYRRKQSLWIRQQILKQLAENPQAKESVLFTKALKETDQDIYGSAVAALEKLTGSQLGSKKKIAEKRELWIQWAKAHPQVSTQ